MIAKVGDVIQVAPSHDPVFGGCFGIVEEVRDWGCSLVGFLSLGKDGVAYYRIPHGKYEVIGRAAWALSEPDVDGEP